MQQYFNKILQFVDRMDPQECLIVMIVLIVAGLFCLRGFGSRSEY